MTPDSTLLRQAALPLYWLMMGAAVWVLLRGHHDPGGGFIGGLVAVAATSLLASTHGPERARRWQPLGPLPLALVGLSLALLSGLGGPVLGLPFLTHLWSAGGLSTVLLFDIGVFLSVWGAVTGYVFALVAPADPQAPS